MGIYVPELGQAVFGNPWSEFEVDHIGDSAIAHALRDIERVFWNRNQRQWDYYEEPDIPGVEFHPYWWGDDDAPEAARPNLKIEGSPVEIRWYKHPGRGNSTNIEMSPNAWADWLNLAMRVIQEADTVEAKAQPLSPASS